MTAEPQREVVADATPSAQPPFVPSTSSASAPPPPPPPSPPPAPPAPPSASASAPSQPGPLLGATPVGAPRFEPGEVASPFAPLRTDPPPRLFATWWLRYLLFLTQLVGLGAVLATAYSSGPGEILESPAVVAVYLLAAVLLVSWSGLAMVDAGRLVPATLYHRSSSGPLVVLLWLVAFAAPFAAGRVVGWATDRFATEPDDLAVVAATAAALLVCFLAIWLPFRYHVVQAHRIGVPARVVAGWFWLPVVAAVGALLITALGLRDLLEDNGLTAAEATVQVAVVFGLPALVLAMATWRATTVFDEVIDLRWGRWRSEWEQTLAAMAAQPPPGPEAPTR